MELIDSVRAYLGKGDLPGHEFHGNQWTEGQGGGSSAIPRSDRPLAPDDRAIEGRFADKLAHMGVDAALAQYASIPDSMGGKVINTDIFRELSDDYLKDRTLAVAVHEPASWIMKQALQRAIDAPPVTGHAFFTSGGSGAGKSSALDVDDRIRSVAEHSDFTFDSNMNNAGKAIARIDATLASGRDVTIAYVARDPVEALTQGVVRRYSSQVAAEGSGRVVPLSEHVNTHVGAAKAIQEVQAHYADDPRVHVYYVDNRGGRGKAALAGPDLPKSMDFANIESRLNVALTGERDAGRLDEKGYRAMFGKAAGSEGPQGLVEVVDRWLRGRSQPPRPEGPAGRTPLEVAVRRYLSGAPS